MSHSPCAVIIRQEAARHRVPPIEILSATRRHTAVVARHAVWARMHAELGYSLSRIARTFHRHHTTIGFAIAKLSGQCTFGVDKLKRK